MCESQWVTVNETWNINWNIVFFKQLPRGTDRSQSNEGSVLCVWLRIQYVHFYPGGSTVLRHIYIHIQNPYDRLEKNFRVWTSVLNQLNETFFWRQTLIEIESSSHDAIGHANWDRMLRNDKKKWGLYIKKRSTFKIEMISFSEKIWQT